MGKLLFDGAVGGHAMVHTPRQVPDLGMQGAAHGDIEFLEPTANAQDRLTPLHAGTDQWQRDTVSVPIKVSVSRRRLVAVFFRVHVWSPAG